MKIPKEPIVCLGGADAKGFCPVRIRFTLKGRVDLYTGITVLSSQWDAENHRVKQGCKVKGVSFAAINKVLQERLDYVNEYRNQIILREDEDASAEELKRQYNAKFMRSDKEQSEEFFFLLQEYIQEQNRARHWSEKYKQQWDTLHNDLKEFKPSLKFNDLSEHFLNSYVAHLAERMSDDKIKEYLKKFKEFIRHAKKKKRPIHQDFFDFSPKFQKRQKEVNYLTQEELLRVISLDYSQKQSLDRTRDEFVFCCCTSLRYSDLSALKRENVRVRKDGRQEVLLVTQKDKGKVWFPLSNEAERIYKKYMDIPYEGDKAFHVPCGTDFRKFLANIGKDAQIEGETISINYRQGKEIRNVRKREKILTHDARRTFIVHAINGGATFEKIALFTSHSEVEQMRPYITLTEQGKEDVCDIINNLTAGNPVNMRNDKKQSKKKKEKESK